MLILLVYATKQLMQTEEFTKSNDEETKTVQVNLIRNLQNSLFSLRLSSSYNFTSSGEETSSRCYSWTPSTGPLLETLLSGVWLLLGRTLLWLLLLEAGRNNVVCVDLQIIAGLLCFSISMSLQRGPPESVVFYLFSIGYFCEND